MSKILRKEEVSLSKLKNWDKNPRSIKKEDFKRLKQQIETLGVYVPLVVDEDYTVLSGNMRLRAFQELKHDPVWVTVVEAKTEEDKVKYALSANDEAGYYDEQQLAELLQPLEINLDEYRVNLGKPISITELLAKFGPDIIEDEPPALEEEAISKRGEVYQLGRHRLVCGDATKIEDVEKLMDGQKADLCYTDPPYGVSYEKKTREIANQRKDILPVKNDELGKDALKEIVFPAFQNIATVLKEGGCYYISSPQGGELGLMMMMMMMMNAGIEAKHMIVWAKDAPVFSMGRLDYDYQHEPILYGWRGSHQHYGNGRYKSSLWNIPRPKDSKLHPTMKPIELIVNIINNSSKQDDIVLDLFGGSGSTLIACEQTNRTCYMCELDSKYVDVIRKRYAKFINKEDIWQEITPLINNQ